MKSKTYLANFGMTLEVKTVTLYQSICKTNKQSNSLEVSSENLLQ